MQKIHNEFSGAFVKNWVFWRHINITGKGGQLPYQKSHRRVANVVQEHLKEGLDWLQKQQIKVPLDVNEPSEWCNSFVLVPKANGKVQLCLDPTRLNKALFRSLHKGHILNYILMRLAGVK